MELERPENVYDPRDELSLINMLGGRLQEVALAVPIEYQHMAEGELRRQLNFTPTRVDHSLRTAFWREFDRAWATGAQRIVTARIYAGVCSDSYFYQQYLTQGHRVAWLILPQQTYRREMEAILARGTARLWDLMEMDIKDPKTRKVCPRRAEILLKVIAEVQNRVKGMAVQNVNKLTVAASVPAKAGAKFETMEQLQARLKELEEAASGGGGDGEACGDAQGLPAHDAGGGEVIEVTAVRGDQG